MSCRIMSCWIVPRWMTRARSLPSRSLKTLAAACLALLVPALAAAAGKVDDAYRPPDDGSGSSLGTLYDSSPSGGAGPNNEGVYYPPRDPSRANGNHGANGGGYGSEPPPRSAAYRSGPGGRYPANADSQGYGEPYHAPREAGPAPYEGRDYGPGPRREYVERPAPGTYSQGEIMNAGHHFFGSVSKGLASVVEYAFQKAGRPNGYVLGEDAGGAFVAGLRYGEGVLYTKDAGQHRVFWQGPSLGYDFGAEGSKTMVLVYNLRDPSEIYHRFGGVQGSAYLVGGVSIQFQKWGDVVLAPIRSGVGLRLGANVGYLKYTRNPTWNPF